MQPLPFELWKEVIDCATYTPAALDTSTPWDPLFIDNANQQILETHRVKLALLLVSKMFHVITTEFFFQIISLRRLSQLHAIYGKVVGDTDRAGHDPDLGFMSRLRRWTRRLDILILDESVHATEFPTLIKVIDACKNLTHLSYHISPSMRMLSLSPSILHFSHHLRASLLYLDWGVYTCPTLEQLATLFPHLRMLSLMGDCRIDASDVDFEFKDLHSVRVGESILHSIHKAYLPSLVSLDVRGKAWGDHMSMAEKNSSTEKFFELHGKQIELLGIGFGSLKLSLLPRLRTLVTDVSEFHFLQGCLTDLTNVGIVPPEDLDSPITVKILEHTFSVLVGTFNASFPALRSIRLLGGYAALLRRKHPMAVRLWDRKFKSNGVRLEDGFGCPLVVGRSSGSSKMSLVYENPAALSRDQ